MKNKEKRTITIEGEDWIYKTWLIYVFRHTKSNTRYLFGGWGAQKNHIRALPLDENDKVVRETVKLKANENVEVIGLIDYNKTITRMDKKPVLAKIKKVFSADDIIYWYDNPRFLTQEQCFSILDIKSKKQNDVIHEILDLLKPQDCDSL